MSWAEILEQLHDSLNDDLDDCICIDCNGDCICEDMDHFVCGCYECTCGDDEENGFDEDDSLSDSISGGRE